MEMASIRICPVCNDPIINPTNRQKYHLGECAREGDRAKQKERYYAIKAGTRPNPKLKPKPKPKPKVVFYPMREAPPSVPHTEQLYSRVNKFLTRGYEKYFIERLFRKDEIIRAFKLHGKVW